MSIYATHWRRTKAGTSGLPADLIRGERFKSYYQAFADQLPSVLAHAEKLEALADDGDPEPLVAEVLVFALPFPADQIVAALVLHFDGPDLNLQPGRTQKILRSCADAKVRVDGRTFGDYVADLVARVGGERETTERGDRGAELPLERHHLVFLDALGNTAPPEDDVVRRILYDINPPYREAFVQLSRPEGLNQESAAFAAVSPTTSLFYGQPDDIDGSVFLTTVQAVGTASRFQQIWHAAYAQVQQFQSGKQAKVAGNQQRRDLETLADEMGNLELDLAFSVETAADLGLRIPSSQVDDFHRDLYDAMQITRRAQTVSQMFVRLGGSIRSELTAIESRERQQEDERRLNGAIALGLLSFLVAPTGFLLGFFGMNAGQIHSEVSMWSWTYYHWAYIFALGLAAAPVAAFAFLHGRALLARARTRSPQKVPQDVVRPLMSDL